jgi:uncharacterized protein
MKTHASVLPGHASPRIWAALLTALASAGLACGASSDPFGDQALPEVPATAGQAGAAEAPLNRAFYLSMRDGVRIAVDLWLPAGASAEQRVPTVMRATRYTRDQEVLDRSATPVTDSEAEARQFVTRGYAEVIVDARGSGASFGTRSHPWSSDEVDDYEEIVDFIVKQPWSDGRIAAFGTSYDGNTAEMIGTLAHPAVQAVIPRFNYPNVYTDIVFPGGVFNQGFVHAWLARNKGFDANDFCQAFGASGEDCEAFRAINGGVKPVDDDVAGTQRAAAVAEHRTAPDQFHAVSGLTYSDDAWNGDDFATMSPATRSDRAKHTRPALMAFASWMDLGTAQGALNRWAATDVPMVVVIGPWSHDGAFDSNPYREQDAELEMTAEQQHARVLDFLDQRFGSAVYAQAEQRSIMYYTLGENRWKYTAQWPPAGTSTRALYLRSGGRLSADAPESDGPSDRYRVDFDASTGADNGWWTKLASGDVYHPDRRAEDEKLLAYTSDPLPADVEITGHPQLTLQLASTESDGAVFVYLEDVAPDGRVTYLTEGQLRLIHRKQCDASVPFTGYGPCHTFTAADASAFPTDTIEEITIGLMPISVSLCAGHSIRVALAGHDASNFARLPARGTPTWTVAHASRIELPVAPTSR